MARARSMLQRALGARGGVLGLRGEPGIGKSRLCHEISLEARESGFEVRRGRAISFEGMPYWVIGALLRDMLDITSIPSEDEVLARVDHEAQDLGLDPTDRHHLAERARCPVSRQPGRPARPPNRTREQPTGPAGVLPRSGRANASPAALRGSSLGRRGQSRGHRGFGGGGHGWRSHESDHGGADVPAGASPAARSRGAGARRARIGRDRQAPGELRRDRLCLGARRRRGARGRKPLLRGRAGPAPLGVGPAHRLGRRAWLDGPASCRRSSGQDRGGDFGPIGPAGGRHPSGRSERLRDRAELPSGGSGETAPDAGVRPFGRRRARRSAAGASLRFRSARGVHLQTCADPRRRLRGTTGRPSPSRPPGGGRRRRGRTARRSKLPGHVGTPPGAIGAEAEGEEGVSRGGRLCPGAERPRRGGRALRVLPAAGRPRGPGGGPGSPASGPPARDDALAGGLAG